MAGVAGTAMTADLGARKIREEIDALMVLGVDPVKSLVVPRFISLTLLTPLFSIYALLFGTFGGVLVTLPTAPARTVLLNVLRPGDHRRVRGDAREVHDLRRHDRDRLLLQGPDGIGRAEGVGRAVNQAVVIAFLAIGAIDYAFTQTLLATHPEINSIAK